MDARSAIVSLMTPSNTVMDYVSDSVRAVICIVTINNGVLTFALDYPRVLLRLYTLLQGVEVRYMKEIAPIHLTRRVIEVRFRPNIPRQPVYS
jgi:hypothetical protein